METVFCINFKHNRFHDKKTVYGKLYSRDPGSGDHATALPFTPIYKQRVRRFPIPRGGLSGGHSGFKHAPHPQTCGDFFVRVSGDSMTGAGIFPGDLLIVDRSLKPTLGRVIIAVLDSMLTVKRLHQQGKTFRLEPNNSAYEPIAIQEGQHFEVWGVVTYVIHPL